MKVIKTLFEIINFRDFVEPQTRQMLPIWCEIFER